ncbi:MAG: hypothetical protein WDM89_14895 [Rhizomicrobium sp.]
MRRKPLIWVWTSTWNSLPMEVSQKATSDALNSSNSYTRASASAAQRAIYTCQPYKLPSDRYSQWREISPFHFDPRQMMGQ